MEWKLFIDRLIDLLINCKVNLLLGTKVSEEKLLRFTLGVWGGGGTPYLTRNGRIDGGYIKKVNRDFFK